MRDVLRAFTVLFTFVFVLLAGPLLFAQVTGAAPVATATPDAALDELFASLIWAFLGSSGLEYIKRKPWLNAVLSEQTAWNLQRAWGIVVAMASALGIHVAFDAAAGTLTVTGLMLGSLYEFGGDALKQWVMQELIYRNGIKNYRPTVP